ncbi:hypothetical protein EDF46_2229 [Frondihabitans sp. PhB188]|uniref:hypothetical protein n=1 Tax=Frondihabitans sp. PhB188 TaxID=2485200 RepID=UPI000F4A8714|nr:hypothetical protein [Frondihabitans sp. PhB188]ROQ38589.1 hypothetical protein EDF46_2229 [Frondihabitans sp. PhB188]
MSPKRRRESGAPRADRAAESARAEGVAGTTSDAKLAARSGRGVAEWFEILDAEAATRLSHDQIVALLVDVYEAPEWGAESVAVRYQRERGIRLPGEQDDGTFAVSVSRSVRGAQVALLDEALVRVAAFAKSEPVEVHRLPERCQAVWELAAGDRLELRVGVPRDSRCAVTIAQSGIRLPERVADVRRALERVVVALS